MSKFLLASLALLIFAPMVLAQTGPELVIKTWGKGQAFDSTTDGILEAAGHTSETDDSIRLSTYHALGRWRLSPDNEAMPRFGYDVEWFDVDSHDPVLPRHFVSGTIGFAQPIAKINDWFAVVTGAVGYAGTSPFADSKALYGAGNLIVGRKFSENRALIIGLQYDGNRTFLPDTPIPGLAYADRYNDFFNYVIGVPLSSITWQPVHGFQVEATYTLVHQFYARLQYQFADNWAVFGQYSEELTPFHLDNTTPDRRIFLQTHDVEAGVGYSLSRMIQFSISGGWAFGQEFSRGFDSRNLTPVRHFSDAPFAKIRLDFGF